MCQGIGREVPGLFKELGGEAAGSFAAAEALLHPRQFALGPKLGAGLAAEFFLFLFPSLGLFAGDLAVPALLLEIGLFGAVVIAAEPGNLEEQFTHALPAFIEIGFLIEQLPAEPDHFGGHDDGKLVADLAEVLTAGFAEFGGLFDEILDEAAGFLVPEPIQVTAVAPFAEVLFTDGAAFELGIEDGLNFGLLVEPIHKGGAGFAVLKAAVQGVADGLGETGDFADAGHRI